MMNFGRAMLLPAFGQKEFYLECKRRMPVGKEIGYYRADSASYQAELFNQLEEDGVKYAITADQDKAVKAVIALIREEEWKEPVRGCGYELAETVHCMNKRRRPFVWWSNGRYGDRGNYLRRRGSIFIMPWRRTGWRRRRIRVRC